MAGEGEDLYTCSRARTDEQTVIMRSSLLSPSLFGDVPLRFARVMADRRSEWDEPCPDTRRPGVVQTTASVTSESTRHQGPPKDAEGWPSTNMQRDMLEGWHPS